MLSHVSAYTQDCGEGEEAAVPVTDAAGAALDPKDFFKAFRCPEPFSVRKTAGTAHPAPIFQEQTGPGYRAHSNNGPEWQSDGTEACRTETREYPRP